MRMHLFGVGLVSKIFLRVFLSLQTNGGKGMGVPYFETGFLELSYVWAKVNPTVLLCSGYG